MASVLVREPALDALPPNLTTRLVDLIKRCLEKQPKKRWQAVGDLRAELEAVAAAPLAVPIPANVFAVPRPFTRVGDIESANLTNATFSPDGRWIAYTTNPGAATTIFVRPFPDTGTQYRISPGFQPLWSPDGRGLSYGRNSQLQIVSIDTSRAVTVSDPTPLTTAMFSFSPSTPRSYDVTPDGKRFIAVTPAGQALGGIGAPKEIHVVLNWFDELKQRVPER